MAFSLVLLLIQTYLFSMRKHGKESCFAAKQIKAVHFFSFPSCDWLYFLQSWHVLYEKLEHRPQRPAAWNAWNALLICDICECFLQ